jgi:hypothetical protein
MSKRERGILIQLALAVLIIFILAAIAYTLMTMGANARDAGLTEQVSIQLTGEAIDNRHATERAP